MSAAVTSQTAGIKGGSAVDLAYDPYNSNTVYAGVLGGGLYKSVDDGATWQQKYLPTGYHMPSVVWPSSTTPNLVLMCDRSSGYGAIWRSPDGGTTWQEALASGTFPNDRNCTTLTEAKALGNTTYYAGVITDLNSGTPVSRLYGSFDSGSTWAQQAFSTAGAVISHVVELPSGVLLMGTRGCAANGCFFGTARSGGLFTSSDAGASWSPVVGTTEAVLGLAVGGGKVFMVTADAANAVHISSSADGTTWSFHTATFLGNQLNQSFYSSAIRFHTASDSFFLNTGAAILQSGAGPVYGWAPPTDWTGDLWSSRLTLSMFAALAPDPGSASSFILGSGGGGSATGDIFRTINGGSNWAVSNAGLYSPWIDYAVKTGPSGYYYAFSGGGLVYFNTVLSGVSSPWTTIYRTTGSLEEHIYAGAYDQLDPKKLFVAMSNNNPVGSGLASKLLRMSDASLAGEDAPPYNHTGWVTMPYPDASQHPIFALLVNGATMYAGVAPRVNSGTGNYLYRSVDGGSTWGPTSLVTKGGVRALAFEPGNPSVVYAGAGDNDGFSLDGVNGDGIYKSVDGGANWSALTSSPTLASHVVRQIVVDTTTVSRLWVLSDPEGTPGGSMAGDDKVWESVNGGAAWAEITGTNHSDKTFLTYAPSEGVLLVASGARAMKLSPGSCAVPCAWSQAFEVYGGLNTLYAGSAGAGSNTGMVEVAGFGGPPIGPAPPTSFAGTAAGTTEIDWTWVDNATTETEYGVLYGTATDIDLEEAWVTSMGPDSIIFYEDGLSTNTAYSRMAAAWDQNAMLGSTSTVATVYTLAAPPTSFALLAVYDSSASVQWAANENPPGTEYQTLAWTAGGSTATALVYTTTATISGLNGGSTYFFSVRARNGDGVFSDPAALVVLSTTTSPVPHGTVLSPPSPYTSSLASLSGEAFAEGGAGITSVYLNIRRVSNQTYWNGSTWNPGPPADLAAAFVGGSSGTWSFSDGGLNAALISGETYEIILKMTDSFARTGFSTVGKLFDVTPPAVFVSTPQNAAYYKVPPAISGSASDLSPILSVEVRFKRLSDNFYWDGASFVAPVTWRFATVYPSSWQYVDAGLGAALVGGQQYAVEARASDGAGNVAAPTSPVTFVFDNVAPVAAITFPTPNSTLSSFPTVTGTAADDLLLATVELSISSGPFHTTRWNGTVWVSSGNTAPVSSLVGGSWDFSDGPTGPDLVAETTYTIRARGVDAAGNAGSFGVAVSSFLYSLSAGTPPTGSITSPVGSPVTSLASVSGTAEAFGGFTIAPSGVEVAIRRIGDSQYWNGSTSFAGASPIWLAATFVGDSSGTWSYTNGGIDFALTPNENYELKIRVTDSNSQVWTDSAPPVVQYVPAPNSTYIEGEDIAPPFFTQTAYDVPVLRLRMRKDSGTQTLNRLTLVMFGDVPPTSVSAKVWRDDNGNGTLDPGTDTPLGTMAFAVGNPYPEANITGLSESIGTTTTQFLLTLSMSNLPGGKMMGVGFFDSDNFGGMTDIVWSNPPTYMPERQIVLAVAANPSAGNYNPPTGAPTRSGGFDSGLFLNNGQQFFVFSTGTWSDGVNGIFPASGSGAGTGGLETGLALGALVGRIGSSPWFEIGAGGYFTAGQNGSLFLAMNDTSYADNSGMVSVGYYVLPSTTPHVWLGGSPGFENRASIPANWSGGTPNPGELVVFDGAAGYDCDWDLPSMYLESLVLASTFTRTLRLVSASGSQPNYLEVDATTVLSGGTLDLGYINQLSIGGDLIVDGATLDMGSGLLRAAKVELRGGAFFKSRSNTLEARIERGYTSDTLDFDVYDATTVVDGSMGLSMYDVGRVLITSMAATTAFDKVQLYRWDANSGAAVVLESQSSISRVFRNWRFEIAHLTNVNAAGVAPGSSIVFQNTDFTGGTNQRGGSPFEYDPNGVVSWNPDGGGTGSIAGQLDFPGGTTASDYAVLITTDPKGGSAELTFRQPLPMNPLPLSYNFNNLQAPNTWYVFGYKGPGTAPQGDDARGGYLNNGWYRSAPIYLAPSASLTNKNVVLGPWQSVSGLVTRATPQGGPIRVQAWSGLPPCSSCTFLSQTFADGSGVYAFNAPQSSAPTTAFRAFVDANNNGQHDGFEAVGSTAGWTVPPPFLTNVNITVGGGSLPPGGTVYLTATQVHTGLVGSYGPRALLKLQMYSAGSNSAIGGVDVGYEGYMPSGADVSAAIFADNGDGYFDPFGPNPDQEAGKTSFDFFNGSSVTAVSFWQTQTITGGSTRTFFLVAGLGGASDIPQFRMFISSSGSFAMSEGSMGSQPAAYPADSGMVQVGVGVYAGNSAYQGSGGGQFTGIQVFEGQTLQLDAYGQWKTNYSTGMVDARGSLDASGNEGQNTVLPSARVGELIGRIDNDGDSTPWFRVGASTSITVPKTGYLLLAMNDFVGAYYDNGGEVVVTHGISGSVTGAIAGTLTYEGGLAGTMNVAALRCWDRRCEGYTVEATTTVSVGVPTTYPFLIAGLPAGEYDLYAEHQSSAPHQGRTGVGHSLVLGSTVTVDVRAFLGLSSLSGTLSYSGVLNMANFPGSFGVAVTTSPDFERDPVFFGSAQISTLGAYTITDLVAPNTYYLVAFADGNNNGEPDGPEPFGYFGTPGAGISDFGGSLSMLQVNVGTNTINADVVLQDKGAISGTAEVPPNSQGGLILVVGRGLPGTPSYAPENAQFEWVPNQAQPFARSYNVGLLRPATDYSLFAYVDKNFNGNFDADEPRFLSPANISVPAAGNYPLNFSLALPSIPPPPSAFVAFSTGTGVEFRWNLVQGATEYRLLDAGAGVVATLGGNASYYHDALLPDTSSLIRAIVAANPLGVSASSATVPLTFSHAAMPSAPTIAGYSYNYAFLNTGSANHAGTLFELWRATSASADFSRVITIASPGVVDSALSPSTSYYWKWRALNGNGIPTPFTASTFTFTNAFGGPSIAGQVFYHGGQTGDIVVQTSLSQVFASTSSMSILPRLSTQAYFAALGAGDYFVRAFVDVNGDGLRQPFEDLGVYGSSIGVTVSAVTSVDFSINADTVAPNSPYNLQVFPGFRQARVNWNQPTTNVDGTPLTDLAGFIVERTTVAAGPFAAVAVLGPTATTYLDTLAIPGVSNVYRVRAQDLGGNQSLPTGTISALPSAGGTIRGQLVRYSDPTQPGLFKVRVSTLPGGNAPFLFESSLSSYSFVGLADGQYFVRGFQDRNNDGTLNARVEPAGTYGGLNNPFPVFITNGNTVNGVDVVVCDRTPLGVGMSTSPYLTAGDCPALDKTPQHRTDLFAFAVGNGAAGSLGLGSRVNLQMTSSFDNELILLGPDGRVVQSDNRAGGFTGFEVNVNQSGVYLVEPTSFLSSDSGGYTLRMSVSGGYSGTIPGTVQYNGSALTGNIVVQLFDRPTSDAFPIRMSTMPAPGAFSLSGLPDGNFYVRAFRDVNFNGTKDLGEASGAFGLSASSLTAVSIQGGIMSAAVGPVTITLVDPAFGAVKGAISYSGTQPGPFRVEAGFKDPSCGGCTELRELVSFTSTGAANTYLVNFLPPSTSYVVMAYIDGNNNRKLDPLEAHSSSSPVTVTANSSTTVSFIVRDPGSGASGNATIRGTIDYTSGTKTGPIWVGFARDEHFDYIDYTMQLASTGNFIKPGILGNATYYMVAFMDVNGDGQPDERQGEPLGIGATYYNDAAVKWDGQPAIYVSLNGSVTAYLTLQDAPTGSMYGRVSYSGAAPLWQPLVVKAYIPNANGEFSSQQATIVRQAGVNDYDYVLDYMSASSSWTVMAFIDANGNQNSDFGEAFGQFGQSQCSNGGPCYGQPISVSSGSGAIPTYGVNLRVNDPFSGSGSGGFFSADKGTLKGETFYLGTLGGPFYVRVYNNSSYSGTPLYTIRVPATGLPPAGPGEARFELGGLEPGVYSADVFRDPGDSGFYNPMVHPHVEYGSGELSATRNYLSLHGNVMTDPGQGGSVNAFTGSFAAAGGARFDGGATDLGIAVSLDSTTAGGPFYYVSGFTDQNDGTRQWIARYDAAGLMLSSVTVGPMGDGNVVRTAYEPVTGKLFAGASMVVDNQMTATVLRYSKDLSALEHWVALSSADVISQFEERGGYLYAMTYPIQSVDLLRKLDPVSLVTVATGSFSGFQGMNGGGSPNPLGMTVAPDGTVYGVISSQGNDQDFGSVKLLVKYGANLGASPSAQADVTPLGIGMDAGMTTDPSGNVFIAYPDRATSLGKTVKFSPSLQQLASASLPVDTRLAVGMGNVKTDAAGDVYEAWGSTSGGGDLMVVRYSPSLTPLYERRFDGFDGTRMDAALGLVVVDSATVVTMGVVDNGRNLDWIALRLNMNASGAASAAGQAVVVTTATAVRAIYGDIRYNGALSSGTVRSFLLPYYGQVPLRSSTAPVGAVRPYIFNALSDGLYRIVSFLDRNENLVADSDEPLAFTRAAGIDFQGVTIPGYDLTLCDRSPLTQGVPVLASLQANDCVAWDHDGAFQKLYTFSGRRGQAVTVSLDAVDFYDTYLMLYDEKGGLVITDDESGGGGNAKIDNFILPYDGQYTVAAAAYAPGITGSFKLAFGGSEGSLGAIEGEVQYNGSQGGQVVVGLFRTLDFSSASYVDGRVLTSTRAFGFANLLTGTTYYLGAFIDVNFNNNPDLGEDGGVLGANGVPSAIYLQNGQTLSGLVLLIQTSTAGLVTQSFVNGVATYTGTQFGPVRLEFWSSASFQGQPVAVRELPTGPGSYDVNLPGGLSYFLRGFMDVNNNFRPDPDEPKGVYSPNNQGAESFFAPASGSVGGIDLELKDPGATAGGGIAGEGTATISPLAVGAGDGLFIATITYTAGSNGISQFGKIGFILPPGLPFPNSVTAAGDAAISPVTIQGPAAFVTVTAVGGLPLGQKVTFYAELFSPCAVGASTFTVASAKTQATAPQPLFNGSPVLSITRGAPRSFQPAQPYFAVKANGLVSERQTLELRDGCGNKTAAVAPVAATLRAKFFNMQNGQFSDDPLMGLTTGTLVATGTVINLPFAVGKSSHPFFVVSHSTGYKNLELSFNLGQDTTFYYGINALAADILTQVGLSSSPTGVQVTSMTLGASQSAFINFRLGDVNNGWRVLVSSQPFKAGIEPTPLWERWGYGQPSVGEIAWDGRYSPWVNNGARVPNGLYFIRIEVGSGVRDDSLLVRASVPQLQGRFFDTGVIPNPPLGSVRINVFGPNGYFYAQTDALGNYSLPGLGAGVNRMEVRRDDYLEGAFQFTLTSTATVSTFTALSPAVSASMNVAGGLDVLMNRAPALRVSIPDLVGVSTQAFDQWGSLQVRTSTSASVPLQLFAPLRVAAGTTTFDDGGQWDPATQQFVTRRSMKFNVPVGTYTVEGFFPGLSRSSQAVYVPTTGVNLTLNPFTARAQISGLVTLPSNPQGTFVSVNAVPLSTAASAQGGFGGVYLDAAVLTGTYTVYGLDAGSYILRANAQGFGAVSSGPVTVSNGQMLGGVDMPVFGVGAQISGNAVIPFSTLGKNLTLYVNAWSPGSMNFGSTQVFVNGQAAPLSIPYVLKGLDVGAQYQMFVNLNGVDGDVNTIEPLPLTVVPNPNAVQDFNFAASSGAVAGTIILPSGSTDFFNVAMFGRVLESPKPHEVGQEFEEATSTAFPSFTCVPAGTPASAQGYCPDAPLSSTATFVFAGLNTQTVEITMLYKRTGETRRMRVPIVNGSTTTVYADLSAQTFSISGSINNQVTNTLFNTNPKIVQNAPFIAPPGWPAEPFSSSTARVLAIRQEITDINAAISLDYNAAKTRVGFLTPGGEFTISSVPAGVYYVRTTPLRACATCDILVPSVGKLIRVSNADVTGVAFALSDGYSVGGALKLDGEMLDARVFELSVRNRRQEVVRSTTVYLGDSAMGMTANSVNYSFTNLPANEFYTISARDMGSPAKYAGAPVKFPDPSLAPNGLQANILGQNIALSRAAFLVGRLKDANTGELIGKVNATLLATNFKISATANPWVEGGFVLAESSVAGRPIQDDGYFRVGPLIPGIPYDLRLGQSSWDAAFLAQGSQNYTPIQVSGLKPGAGESKDVGVLSLNQGQSISGFVRSSGTLTALGNIKVVARPSFAGSVDGVVIQTYTNPLGKYTLWVSTFISNQYDITAAPRGGNQASDGFYYGAVNLRAVNLLATTTADFLLNPLLASVTGQVVVADAAAGGELSYPFGDQKGFPAAAINLQPYGVVSRDPLGDIQTITDGRGQFSLPGMSTGTYALRATSLGYIVGRATVTVTGAGFRIFTGSDTPSNYLAGNTITLVRGASVSGRVLKSDGSAPNSTEVGGVAAANFAAGEFVIGSVEIDPTAKTVSAYSISGFKTGVSYDLVILPAEKGEDVSFPPEGAGVTFSALESTTTKNINLTFASVGIDCAATSKALGNSQFQVKIDCTKALRDSLPADNDLDLILSISTGTGQLLGSEKALSANRRQITAIYRAAANETAFRLRLRATATTVNVKTGLNFTLDKVFDFYTGVDAKVVSRVTNMQGGSVELLPSAEDETLGLDERSKLDLQAGTFAQEGETNAASTITVSVGIRKGKDRETLSALYARKLGYTPASVASLRPSSFPSEMSAAMSAYRTLASTTQIGGANPLSSFYDIFLPAGIRHQLKQNADLTLSYTLACATCTPTDNINVWFYNATTGKYELENRNRRIDTVNKTITVAVDHFSVFTVLDSTPVLSARNPVGAEKISIVNIPNPADCITHANITRNASLFPGGGVLPAFRGTMLRYTLPGSAGVFQDAKINIYNVAGELVKTLNVGNAEGQTTNYTPWDCSSDGGGTVSSGVYIGEISWGGQRAFVKIAIIKGSGL